MIQDLQRQLSKFLERLAQSIDIPDTLYERAVDRYRSLGTWLERDASVVVAHGPNIYPQGSFCLGTVVRPLSDYEEYDVDLVCELDLAKTQVSQEQLKQLVGDEVKSYASGHGMKNPVREGRRCWTLDYSDEAQFHMDILPAIPDVIAFRSLLESLRLPGDYTDGAIAITDTEGRDYTVISNYWPRSNPKGYAAWFRDRMRVQFDACRALLAESLRASVDDIPEYRVKTPLQQSIQILKRHRDMSFADDQDDKPISIIITTLAALSYNNEADLLEALMNIVMAMPQHIQTRNGRAWIPNPVNPLEDFADKWREHPQRETKLRNWLRQVRSDIDNALNKGTIEDARSELAMRFGQRAITQAMTSLAQASSGPEQPTPLEARQRDRFSVTWRQDPPWPMMLTHSVRVSGRYKLNGTWRRFSSEPSPLPKYRDLLFAAESDILSDYVVYWQVVNTGEEARRAGQLRGEMMLARAAGVGGRNQKERTLYTGMHWIECFLVKDGVCRARSGEFVVNIE